MFLIEFFTKSIRFIRTHLLRDPIFVLQYGIAYFKDGYRVSPHFYKEEEVIKSIKDGKSYIRLGDGEIALLRMIAIDYQKNDTLLSNGIRRIITEYNEQSSYVLAIPSRYVGQTNADLKKIGLFRCWMPFKVTFNQIFPSQMYYADAHSFYVKDFFEEKITPLLQDKYIIVNTTEGNIAKNKEGIEKHMRVVSWIVARSPNPFDWFESTKEKIREKTRELNMQGIHNSEIVVIASAGPMSKVLAFEMCQEGIQVIDVGHGFEKFYTNDMSLQKVLI